NSLRGDTWEQFEEGQTAGDVGIASVVAVPNPAPPGETVVITVTLTSPATTAIEVAILLDGQQQGTVPIPLGATSGTFELPIPAEQQPATFTLTARLGSSEATTTLAVESGVVVNVIALNAVPNPARPADTVAITVTLANPAPAATSVQLLAANQPVGA